MSITGNTALKKTATGIGISSPTIAIPVPAELKGDPKGDLPPVMTVLLQDMGETLQGTAVAQVMVEEGMDTVLAEYRGSDVTKGTERGGWAGIGPLPLFFPAEPKRFGLRDGGGWKKDRLLTIRVCYTVTPFSRTRTFFPRGIQ